MPGPSVELEMRMRDNNLRVGMDALATKEDQIDKGFGKIAGSAKKAEQELARFAKQTEALHGAPIERYAARFKKLEDAFASGKVSLIAYTNAKAALRRELEAAQAAFDGTAAKLKQQEEAAQRLSRIQLNSLKLATRIFESEYDQRQAAADRLVKEVAAKEQWLNRVKLNSARLATKILEDEMAQRRAASDRQLKEVEAREQWHARVVMNSARLATKILEDEHRKRERSEAKAARESQKLARQQAAFMDGPLAQLRNMALSYVGLSQGIRLVGDALRHGKQQSQEALGSLRSLDDERRKLAQLAIDMPPGSLGQMQQRANRAAQSAGVDRATAMNALFTAHSFGFQDQYEDVMRMNPLIDVKAAAQLTGKVRTMMGAQNLTPSQIVSMAIEAGQPSDVDAETIAGAMAQAAEGGRRVGSTPEETMGLLSALTTYFAGRGEGGEEGNIGASRVAAQRLRTFGHKVAQRLPELPQKGFIAAFRHVQGMHPLDREKFLQENEELGGLYAALGEALPQAETTIAAVTRARDAAAGTSNVERGLALRARDPASAASLSVKRSELAKEIAKEQQLGLAEAGREAALNRTAAAGHDAGLGILQSFTLGAFGSAASLFRANPRQTAAVAAIGAQVGGALGGGDTASGGTAFWSFLGNLFSQQVAEARLQTELLGDIRDNLQPRANAGAAAAMPLN